MNRLSKLALIFGTVFISNVATSATLIADSRGNGMGNTGVASADYLLAPFYNPALAAEYDDSDGVSILIPAFGLALSDSDDTISALDDLQDDVAGGIAGAQIHEQLDHLANADTVSATTSLGFAVAIPSEQLSMNLFSRRYVELFANTDIANNANATHRYNNSSLDLAAFSYTEYGVTFGKKLRFGEQPVSLGFSPKYQQLKTYRTTTSVDDYDLDDYKDSEVSKNVFNFDIGAVWTYDAWYFAAAIKNVLAKNVTDSHGAKYNLDPLATVAASYSNDYYIAAFDVDLSSQRHYANVEDDTQYVRLGIESNLWQRIKLRAGYQIETQGTLADAMTFGIGIRPFDLINIDIAGMYSDESDFGGSANLALNF
jgi:hypothetical protein